jgi:hypothetical protein
VITAGIGRVDEARDQLVRLLRDMRSVYSLNAAEVAEIVVLIEYLRRIRNEFAASVRPVRTTQYHQRSREGGAAMSDLRDVLKQVLSRIERFQQQSQRISEENTKASLIEPVIGALGWELVEPDEVHREYRRGVAWSNPVDYALLISRVPRVFVEAKGFAENLDDPRWGNQIVGYATNAGVEWVVLTNGADWRIYNAHAPVPFESKLFRQARLEAGVDDAADVLGLLGRENIRCNRIDELWKGQFIDRQVSEALTALFSASEPDADLVGLIGRRLPRMKADEIKESLTRARATFDFPMAATPSSVFEPVAGPSEQVGSNPSLKNGNVPGRPPGTMKRRVSAAERGIRVADLVEAGRLGPSTALRGEYFGKVYDAELLADGRVVFNGKSCTSLTAAGREVKVSVRGPNAPESALSTDGWDFWRARDLVAGDTVTMKEIRRRVAGGFPEEPGR